MTNVDVYNELLTLVGGTRSLLEQTLNRGHDEIPLHANSVYFTSSQVCENDLSASLASTQTHRSTQEQQSEKPQAILPGLEVESTNQYHHVFEDSAHRSVEEKAAHLLVIQEQVVQCTRCILHQARTQTVFARGSSNAEIMFVGEGPGADEDAQGIPFVGAAGRLLDKMIVAMGVEPEQVYVANVVKCRPPGNRKPEPIEVASCEGYLHQQIALIQPRVIVALGATAVESLLKTTGITKLRGTWRLYRGQIPVMPTFHPAYLLRNPAAKREVWSDLKLVMTKLGYTPKTPIPSVGSANNS